ncbi:MAG: hypothetical protein ACRDWY_05165 [Actinomycetes bacterium]
MLRVRIGRHRRVEPAVVTVVLASGDDVVLPPESPLARAMGEVARLLAHW